MFTFCDMSFHSNTANCLLNLLTQSFDEFDSRKKFDILYQQNCVRSLKKLKVIFNKFICHKFGCVSVKLAEVLKLFKRHYVVTNK